MTGTGNGRKSVYELIWSILAAGLALAVTEGAIAPLWVAAAYVGGAALGVLSRADRTQKAVRGLGLGSLVPWVLEKPYLRMAAVSGAVTAALLGWWSGLSVGAAGVAMAALGVCGLCDGIRVIGMRDGLSEEQRKAGLKRMTPAGSVVFLLVLTAAVLLRESVATFALLVCYGGALAAAFAADICADRLDTRARGLMEAGDRVLWRRGTVKMVIWGPLIGLAVLILEVGGERHELWGEHEDLESWLAARQLGLLYWAALIVGSLGFQLAGVRDGLTLGRLWRQDRLKLRIPAGWRGRFELPPVSCVEALGRGVLVAGVLLLFAMDELWLAGAVVVCGVSHVLTVGGRREPPALMAGLSYLWTLIPSVTFALLLLACVDGTDSVRRELCMQILGRVDGLTQS